MQVAASRAPVARRGAPEPGLKPTGAGLGPTGALLARVRRLHAAMFDAVLCGEGLQRVAELASDAAGAPVVLLVGPTPYAPRGLARRELTALAGWAGKRRSAGDGPSPPGAVAHVPIESNGSIAGDVVLLTGADPSPTPEACESLHLAASATRVALAIRDERRTVERELRGSLLEELRSRGDLDANTIIRRAARLGCDLTGGVVVLCADIRTDRPHLAAATIASDFPNALVERVTQPDGRQTRLYAALPATGGDLAGGQILAGAKRLADRLDQYGTAALSSFHSNVAEVGAAVREAELVLEVRHHTGTNANDEIGSSTFKLLFRMFASYPEEVQRFYEATIGPLAAYDQTYRTELVRTLQAYLGANGNMNATASATFTHRHTVAYRLERVTELTGLKPSQSEDRERLGLGLKIHRIMEPRLPR